MLNYQIQADRKAMAEANKAGATAKTEAEDVPDHMKPDVWEPYPVRQKENDITKKRRTRECVCAFCRVGLS